MRMIHYYSVKITIHKKLLKHSNPIAVCCQIIFRTLTSVECKKKTELIVFSKNHSKKKDQFLTFQNEIEIILRKMACGIKTLQSIKKPLPVKNRLLIMHALVISHLHYPAILLSGISANLMISLEKKQLSWAVKSCCDRAK